MLAIAGPVSAAAARREPCEGRLLMKAVVYDRYGPPEVLSVQDVEHPAPGPKEVVLKVEAVSVNLSDWEALTGSPLYVRVFGLLRPRHRVLGSDIAGTVVAAGPEVNELAVGDEVFGDALGVFGGFAEYACIPAAILMKKPAALSFEQVATIPQASTIAIQGLRAGGELQPGQRVLINGAGGGSGMFAVQIARGHGAHVTAVDSAAKLDHMRALGAHRALDYRRVDFTRSGERYDLILDLVGTRSPFRVVRALSRGGTYSMVGGTMGTLARVLLLGPIAGRWASARVGVLAAQARFEDFETILAGIESGALKITVDRRFELEDAAEAVRCVGTGQALGKVVVRP
jgi:NADPH:quinone reductase-like Zn-dependent oxidoreductase